MRTTAVNLLICCFLPVLACGSNLTDSLKPDSGFTPNYRICRAGFTFGQQALKATYISPILHKGPSAGFSMSISRFSEKSIRYKQLSVLASLMLISDKPDEGRATGWQFHAGFGRLFPLKPLTHNWRLHAGYQLSARAYYFTYAQIVNSSFNYVYALQAEPCFRLSKPVHADYKGNIFKKRAYDFDFVWQFNFPLLSTVSVPAYSGLPEHTAYPQKTLSGLYSRAIDEAAIHHPLQYFSFGSDVRFDFRRNNRRTMSLVYNWHYSGMYAKSRPSGIINSSVSWQVCFGQK